MASIFLSYAREDRDKAETLSWELEQRGAAVWWDRHLLSGERYIEAILRQINEADHVVLLLSRYAAQSEWVAFEVGAARSRETSSGREILKVAQLDACSIPGFIADRQATPIESNVRQLILSLRLPEHVDWKKPAGEPDVALTVFRAGSQWMELVLTPSRLSCVLVDSGEQRARIQWTTTREEALDYARRPDAVRVERPRDDRGWSVFSIGPYESWRWSPVLFRTASGEPPEQTFETKVRDLLRADPRQNRSG